MLLYVTFFPKRVHELKGLCCAVTGASDGLGVFIAHARRVEKLEEVKADLAKHFPKARRAGQGARRRGILPSQSFFLLEKLPGEGPDGEVGRVGR